MSGELYMAVELGTTKADMAFEINKLRGKLQRADKKIKHKMGIIDELHDNIKSMMCKNSASHHDSERQSRYYRDLYDTGLRIRNAQDATIIEKDKSIGGLVDRVSSECEKNAALEALVFNAKSDANALLDGITKLRRENKHLSKVGSELTKANDIIRNLRDKYEPKYVRCEGYGVCLAHTCPHWYPHTESKACVAEIHARCIKSSWNCIPWRGDV